MRAGEAVPSDLADVEQFAGKMVQQALPVAIVILRLNRAAFDRRRIDLSHFIGIEIMRHLLGIIIARLIFTRIYMIAFVTMLIVMSVGYVCVGGLMLWAVFF